MREFLSTVERKLHGIIGSKKQKVFSKIYVKNRWNNKESLSGPGSTIKYTENLRNHLPALIQKFNIKSILDAPCGDLNWMKLVLDEVDVDYTGADIVLLLVNKLKAEFSGDRMRFLHLDITKDPLPTVDLMLCRDCLFHLPEKEIMAFFSNFLKSGIPFLLTSTHINDDDFENTDIKIGGFRLIDLCSHPYHLPSIPLAAIDDWVAPFPPRRLCLWNREQIATALNGEPLEAAGLTM